MNPTFRNYVESSHEPGPVFDPKAAGRTIFYEHRIDVVPDKGQVVAFQNNRHGTRVVVKEL